MNQVLIPKIIQEKYPELTKEEVGHKCLKYNVATNTNESFRKI